MWEELQYTYDFNRKIIDAAHKTQSFFSFHLHFPSSILPALSNFIIYFFKWSITSYQFESTLYWRWIKLGLLKRQNALFIFQPCQHADPRLLQPRAVRPLVFSHFFNMWDMLIQSPRGEEAALGLLGQESLHPWSEGFTAPAWVSRQILEGEETSLTLLHTACEQHGTLFILYWSRPRLVWYILLTHHQLIFHFCHIWRFHFINIQHSYSVIHTWLRYYASVLQDTGLQVM